MQEEVCFLRYHLLSRWCHNISSISRLNLLPLSEPDKRLSHTSGSSVSPSVRLRSTTRVQVFAEPGFGPFHTDQGLFEVCPGVRPALALAVEPFVQDFLHITVGLLALTEPDKRISHTSGSSVRYSANLRSTTRVQVFVDSWFRPPHPL